MKTSSQIRREIDEFLQDADARLAQSRARGGGYVGESGEYDPALQDLANRAAQIRHDRKMAERALASRRRAYARRSKSPTRANLAARIADLETLRSSTQGTEQERYDRALEAARHEIRAP